VGSRLILSSGFTITARLLRARDLAPLFKAAASRPEEGERDHRGRYFIRGPPCQDVGSKSFSGEPAMSQSTQSSAHPDGLSMLDKRKIEAEILKEVYETLKESHGVEVAKKTVAESVRRSAIEQARQFAAVAPGGSSLKAFVDVMPLWTKGGALEIEVKEQTDTTFTFNVVRCQYAETYKAMGLGEIGALLSCNRDGAFCEGYDPKLKLERSQTIMGGASHCDFKYRYED
jgi:hypothetical protein